MLVDKYNDGLNVYRVNRNRQSLQQFGRRLRDDKFKSVSYNIPKLWVHLYATG